MRAISILIIIILLPVFACQAQRVRVEYTRDGDQRDTRVFSDGRLTCAVDRAYNGWQLYDSTLYEYLGDDTLVLHTYTPIYHDIDQLKGYRCETDTVVGYSLHPTLTRLFAYDAFSLLYRFRYDDPYEYIPDDLQFDSVVVDSVPVRHVGDKTGTRMPVEPENVRSTTRFGRYTGRTWFSFVRYGAKECDQFQFVIYTTANGRLVSDRFVTTEYVFDRAYVYDDMNRLLCVLTTRTSLVDCNDAIRWTDHFEYYTEP